MELKLVYRYGLHDHNGLLIVPYGIETKYSISGIVKRFNLLIVPYGIETAARIFQLCRDDLLIVPYGIETSARKGLDSRQSPLNCTLWN